MLVRHWEAHSLSLSYLTSQQPHGVSSVWSGSSRDVKSHRHTAKLLLSEFRSLLCSRPAVSALPLTHFLLWVSDYLWASMTLSGISWPQHLFSTPWFPSCWRKTVPFWYLSYKCCHCSAKSTWDTVSFSGWCNCGLLERVLD
jgi:hypothetical protein